MTTINEFNNQENMNLLWEIIYDVHNSNALAQQTQITNNIAFNIKQDFDKKINMFVDSATRNNVKMDLLSLNKTFIFNYMNGLNQSQKSGEREKIIRQPLQSASLQSANLQSASSEPELITFEDIQKNKQSEFEKVLKLKQKDFQESMTNQVPETPVFKISELDKPIGGMEELIAQTLAQRNFEIEQIHNQYMNPKEAEKWLKPTPTSVNSEKGIAPIIPTQTSSSKSIVISSLDSEKRVTWGENISFEIEEKYQSNENKVNTSNIFSKLKMKNPQENNSATTSNLDTNLIENLVSNLDPTLLTNNIDIAKAIKVLQEDVKKINDDIKTINTLVGQLLENKIE